MEKKMTNEIMKAIIHEMSDACKEVALSHSEEILNATAHQLAICMVNVSCDVLKRLTSVKDDALISKEIEIVANSIHSIVSGQQK